MIGASNVQPGPRMAGAFIRNVQVRQTSPSSGATNTSSTVSLQGVILDPFRRSGAVLFTLDRLAGMTSPSLQSSAAVNGTGWADTPLAWASAAIGNGLWYWRARTSLVKVGAGPNVPNGRWSPVLPFNQAGGAGIPRSLYTYVNEGVSTRVAGVGSHARNLYLYVNKGVRNHLDKPYARMLYLYVNKAMYPGVLTAGLQRSLYLYETTKDGEVFPWLMRISPTEQFRGGQVSLYGDGFGQFLECRAAASLTVSGTSGANIAEYVRDGTAAQWLATNGASSWIRFTFGAAKRIVAIVLEGATTDSWGVPRFRFDDASSQDGGSWVPVPSVYGRDAQYPVGSQRTAYWLATPKVSTYVEVAIASGGSGTNRGLSEVWILEEIIPQENAETSRAWLNLDLPSVTDMGIVTWQNRSANLYPANGGLAVGPAAVVTVPATAVSGLVIVQEET